LLECTLLDLATSTRFTQRTLWSPRSTLFPYTTLFRSLFLLLRHGAAHQVRLDERIAEQLRADLHDLLLVDDDAVRLFQDRLELGVLVFDRLQPVQAAVIGGDVIHRAGAVERNARDDVLETLWAHVGQ